MDTIDDIGRRAAASLRADVDAMVDLDDLLRDLAGRVDAPRGVRRRRPDTTDRRPRRWAAWGAAAAVAAAAVAAAIVIVNREPTGQIVPAPSVPPSPVPTAPPGPTEPPATAAAPSTAPSTVPPTTASGGPVGPPASGDGLAVSYRTPPPFLQPQPLGTVELTDLETGGGAVVGESGVVVLDGERATVVGWDGTTRTVDLRLDIEASGWGVLGAGPGDVVYLVASGIDQTNFSAATVAAIPLSGSRAGEIVATTPADINGMIERPVGWVGHGPTGLIDRQGRIGELAPYVDESGAPWPVPLSIAEYHKDGDTVTRTDGSTTWPLQVERAAGSGDSYVGESPPVPAPGGGAVWWELIGPRSSDADFARGSLPVIAFLAPDGSATWRRVPDGWQVVAADVWGTVLARRLGTTLELALATTAEAATAPPTAAQQAVTDYLTALASRDYEGAEAILGNSGLSPSERPDLLPIRDLLGPDEDLAGALQQWCEGGAACWMPDGVSPGAPTPEGAPTPRGTDVVATYGSPGPGAPSIATARFVATTWEGQPVVYGLPPLVGFTGAGAARAALGVAELFVDDPDDVGGLWMASAGGVDTVGAPLRGVGMHAVASDGSTVTWTTPDPVHSVVTDTRGGILCEAEGMIAELRGGPGAYRAVLEQDVESGSPDDPAPRPATEVDCASGAETPTDPLSWNAGLVQQRLLTVGDRTFTLTSTDHHGELTSDAGVVLGPDDPLVGTPAFSLDGSVVVYPTTGGIVPANPNVSTRLVAVDTTTGERRWERVLPTDIAGVLVTSDRAVVTTRADVSGMQDVSGRPAPPAALTAVDLATGEIIAAVPASLDVIHVS